MTGKKVDRPLSANARKRRVELSTEFLGKSFADNPKFMEWIGLQAAQLSIRGDDEKEDDFRMEAFVSLVHGVAPQDELEAMLAVQMAAIHNLTVKMAGRLANAGTIQQQDSAERTLNKLARTFATQMEALKRYRSTGEQHVVVEHQHVHVYPGAQAVVGTVNQGMGGQGEIGGQSDGRTQSLRIPEGAPMLSSIEADGVPVSGASAEREDGVPVSRWKSRRPLRAV